MQSIQRGILPTMAAIILLSAVGCAPERIFFGDNIDLAFDFSPVVNNQEAMHQPYVRGSDFRISVLSRWLDEDMTDWTVVVVDPSILEISNIEVREGDDPDDPESMHMDAVALSEGVTALEVYGKRGQFITATPIEVAIPDNVRLKPNGPLCIHDKGLIVDDNAFQVIEGGLSTYLVEWYRGARRLYGNETLGVSTAGDIDTNVEQSFLFEDRDWLQVTPTAMGDHEVTLYSDGVLVETVLFETVAADDVGHLVLHGESEAGAEEEDWLVVLAQSYDFVGRPIYGIEFDWTLDDMEEQGLGDLYRYEYAPAEENLLEAFFDGHTDAIQIHGSGHVSSSNYISCAVGGAGNGVAAAAVALLALLGLVRRAMELTS